MLGVNKGTGNPPGTAWRPAKAYRWTPSKRPQPPGLDENTRFDHIYDDYVDRFIDQPIRIM